MDGILRTESDPSLRVLAGSGDSQTSPLAGIQPEVMEVLGEETCSQIAGHLEKIGQLDELAAIRSPFDRDNQRPSTIDLSALDPKIIKHITGHKIDRKRSDFNLFSEYSLGTVHPNTVVKLGGKFTNLAMDNISKLSGNSVVVENDFQTLDDGITEASENTARLQLTTDETMAWLEGLAGISDRLPPEADLQMIEKFLVGAKDCLQFQNNSLNEHSGIRTWLAKLSGPVSDKILGSESDKLAKVKSRVESIRERANKAYTVLSEMIKSELVKEGSELLDVITEAQEQLLADINSAERSDTYLTVEAYLQEQARTSRDAIRAGDPKSAKKPEVKAELARVLRPAVEEALRSAEDSGGMQEVIEVDEKFLSGISEARNILRSARRLKPEPGGLSKDQIEAKADGLHDLEDPSGKNDRLLAVEESGIIMAIIAGRFSRFTEVLSQIKSYGENLQAFPKDRVNAVSQLNSFNLTAVLLNVQSILGNSRSRLVLQEFLGKEDLDKVRSTIDEALAPEPTTEPQQKAS